MAYKRKPRKHPNEAWFRNQATLPKPEGKPVPLAVPFVGVILLLICLLANGISPWFVGPAFLATLYLFSRALTTE